MSNKDAQIKELQKQFARMKRERNFYFEKYEEEKTHWISVIDKIKSNKAFRFIKWLKLI